MADFSLTTMFVVPVGSSIPSSGDPISTQDLTAGQVGFFNEKYVPVDDNDIADGKYFYVAQGRANTYLQGSKRSDKIKGCPPGGACHSNVTEWYKVKGCPTPVNQISQISGFDVKCGDILTLTIRAHSSYIDTLYFNGFTRSVTVNAPCCECDDDPCDKVDVPALIDDIIVKLNAVAPSFSGPGGTVTGANPDNISLSTFFTFVRVGDDENAILQIEGKPLTKYGQPCDVAAFPHEYDRLWFRTFVYSGPATTADFIVSDACNIVAVSEVTQESNYAVGTAAEIKQMEKNYYSYQAGYLKHLYRIAGYNPNFESYVDDDETYSTFYIKFNDYDAPKNTWGDYVPQDNMVIIAVATGSQEEDDIQDILEAALGDLPGEGDGGADNDCITTTSTTTSTTTLPN